MAKRPFFNSSANELESTFQENKHDAGICRQLIHELNFRSTPKAIELKQRIATSLKSTSSAGAQSRRFAERPEKLRARGLSECASPGSIVRPSRAETLRTHSPISKPPVTNATEAILRAWTALEVLSPPQGFRRETDLAGGDRSRIASLEGSLLPWEKGERSRPRKRLYYELILGTIDIGPAVDALLTRFADHRPDATRIDRRSPLASILLDRDGRPLEDETGIAISSFAWGVPVALEGDLKALARWPGEERALTKALRRELIKRDEENEVLPLDRRLIETLYDLLVDALGLADQATAPPRFAIRHYEYFASKVPPEPSLLNSFYLEDLAKARDLHHSGKLPRTLRLYLGKTAPGKRIDLLEDLVGLRTLLQPARTPLGRWPGPARFSLALLQQAAVNGTTELPKESSILSVNGPPGTGKTTLLRDIVAARIVDRAMVMAEYRDPKRAFSPTAQTLRRSGARITLHKLDERLKGFEMVVASSNNKAVENISAALPALDAIASDATELRYFSSVSDHVFERFDHALKHRTWGCIAAVLGNASNRFLFAEAFWRDEERGLSTYLDHVSGVSQYVMEPQENGPPLKRLRRIVDLEKPPKNQPEARRNWQRARASFLEAVERARHTQEKRQEVHEALVSLERLAAQLAEARTIKPVFEHAIGSTTLSKKQARDILNRAVSRLERALHALSAHDRDKPPFFERPFGTRAVRNWRTERDRLASLVREWEGQTTTAQERLDRISQKAQRYELKLEALTTALHRLEDQCLRLKNSVANGRAEIAAPIPDKSFFAEARETIQLAHLWFDEADSLQRDRVFEAAMALHRAFIDCAADPIRQNLAIFTESFGTRSLGKPEKDRLIPDLWSTFFMVVPVVSTTFASVHRMFRKIEPGTLGWLLVDEAGQAVPQAAVGAMMRAKRAVVVGDPLQIEPVVTLPNTLTEEICACFGVGASLYNAPEASVQTLADAASPYCARFPAGSGYRDVGSPLLVHRRCDSPMFEISNEIAYANLMVTAKKPREEPPILGPSRWHDVVGQPGPDKWCADEAKKLIDLLRTLRSKNVLPDIYVVTPFVVVQDRLRDALRSCGILKGWCKDPYQWVSTHVGTVHTVQGREADIVFFVLGAQAASQQGARAWAGGRPNLVNVAVTRAQSSLYVIGNRSLWKNAGVFRILDQILK